MLLEAENGWSPTFRSYTFKFLIFTEIGLWCLSSHLAWTGNFNYLKCSTYHSTIITHWLRRLSDPPSLEFCPINWPISIPQSVRHSVHPSLHVIIFGLSSKTAPRIFPIICMSVEDNRAYRLSQMVVLKKFIIADYRGLSDQKRYFWTFLAFCWKWL